MNQILHFLPYAIAIMIAIPFLVLLRQFVHTYVELKERELNALGVKAGNEMRFQAFERMTVFLERIKPSYLISRFDKSLEKHEFLYLTDKIIQEEFDYNISQQMFISSVNWHNIVNSKERMIKLLHSTYEGLGQNVSLEDYKSVLLLNYINEGDFITETLEELKKELLILNFKA